MARLARQRAVQADDVRCADELVEGQIAPIKLEEFRIFHRIAGDDPAAEPVQDPGEREPDAPDPDDPHGLVLEIEAKQPVEREIAFAHPRMGAVGLAVEREDQRQCVFGDGVRRIVGHARDPDPYRCGRGKVDIVEARAP